jgi:RNA recognition motif-containing protein
MSVRLYVGNLPKELDRKELEALFAEEFGDFASTKVITDRKTGKCRGFGFVTVKTSEQADQVIEKFNGYVFKDNALKIEKALPRSKGKEEEPKVADDNVDSGNISSPRSSKGKTRRSSTSYGSTQSDAVQPDPRWAQELEKLKQLLATQASNS